MNIVQHQLVSAVDEFNPLNTKSLGIVHQDLWSLLIITFETETRGNYLLLGTPPMESASSSSISFCSIEAQDCKNKEITNGINLRSHRILVFQITPYNRDIQDPPGEKIDTGVSSMCVHVC